MAVKRAVAVSESTDRAIQELAEKFDCTKQEVVRVALDRLLEQKLANADFRRREIRPHRGVS